MRLMLNRHSTTLHSSLLRYCCLSCATLSLSSVCQQAKDVLAVWLQVHAYTACPNDETAYLAELKSGKEVLVVNAQGQQKTALVGRVKIETRPLVSTVTTVDTVYNSSPLRLLCT